MGNCIKIQSSKSWQGDDHDDDDPFDHLSHDQRLESKQLICHRSPSGREDGGPGGEYGAKRGTVSTEVKIRMTKKQLEELVSVVELQGLSIEDLLKKLANFAESTTGHRHWRPALQSIPEME